MKKKVLVLSILLSAKSFADTDSTKLNWFGDIRQRNESVYNENPGAGKNDRFDHMRLRARLGMKAQPTEDVQAEIRLATGSGAVSTNQSYGDGTKGMRSYDFKLDRAYMKWFVGSDVNLILGKMASPFVQIGASDLIFDTDLNFDGSAVTWNKKAEQFQYGIAVGEFIFEQVKDNLSSSDSKLNSIQLNGRWKLNDEWSVGATLAQHSGLNIKDHTVFVTTSTGAANFYGNANDGTKYLNDYTLQTAGVDFRFNAAFPVVFYYEQSQNNKVTTENKAWIMGVVVKELKNKGDWNFSIDTREVSRDSVIGMITDDDSGGGGANSRSVRTNFGYAINNNLNVSLTSFNGEKNIASGDSSVKRERFHADLLLKF